MARLGLGASGAEKFCALGARGMVGRPLDFTVSCPARATNSGRLPRRLK